ncbi:MAG: RecQ family ATP-dependent DNA helicase, partial [Clostridiales bacterium]|nr:RecQ family ATP-dependent DNA helicase [Clostridiales bacterium]
GQDVLGIMPTGAGKSACFQIPALLKGGITLVVSPLISLMKDQVMALIAAGVPAAYINSSLSPAQCSLALRRASAGHYKLVYIAPERLLTATFLHFAKNTAISLVAVDEAHCVSQWGQDFRPSYLNIPQFIEALPHRPPVAAFTATATIQVKDDIIRLLRLKSPCQRVTGFDRDNLRFLRYKPKDKDKAVLDLLAQRPNACAIIYCATRKSVDGVCDFLRQNGYAATRYHAGMEENLRRESQDDFQYDRARIMVATNAFGMGIDKSNVQLVIHYHMPKNLESYYQEAGRAGRDGTPADCILLYAKRDAALARYMIERSDSNPDMSFQERARLMEIELERLKQMTFYATISRCLRQSILRYFGEKSGSYCGNCSVCLGMTEQLASPGMKQPEIKAALTLQEQRFAGLRALRNQIARGSGLPAYTVFSDATLREMALVMPRTAEEMLKISGIGKHKLAQYGELFLGYLRKLEMLAVGEDGLDITSLMALAQSHWEGKAKWPSDELSTLKAEISLGLNVSAIAALHERTPESIKEMMIELGLRPRF